MTTETTETTDHEPKTMAGRAFVESYLSDQEIEEYIGDVIRAIEVEAVKRAAGTVDVGRLATALGGWVRHRWENCGEDAGCSHDWAVAEKLARELASTAAPEPGLPPVGATGDTQAGGRKVQPSVKFGGGTR